VAIAVCISTAQRTASRTLGNSKQAIASSISDAAVVRVDLRIENLVAERFHSGKRPALVATDEP
jgi:hypothetical protein